MPDKNDHPDKYLWIDSTLFYGAAFWLIYTAAGMSRAYQDVWILDGLEIMGGVFFLVYCVSVAFRQNLAHIANLTAGFNFLLYTIPSIKYVSVYSTTVDNAKHISLIRNLTFLGVTEPQSPYVFSPGFHSIVAMVSQLSGFSIEFWGNIMVALLSSVICLGYYLLIKKSEIPRKMGKFVIILAGISQPLLYLLNGTSFSIPIFSAFLIIFYLRESTKESSGSRVSLTSVVLLLIVQIIFWHPATSFVIPLIVIIAGILISLDKNSTYFLKWSKTLTIIGMEALILGLTYWMYEADFIWSEFVRNIDLALQPDLSPKLIPVRLFDVTIIDQIKVIFFIHVRDAIFVGFSFLGIVFLYRYKKGNPLTRLVTTSGVIWALCSGLVLFVFIVKYGEQGYQRFLLYVVSSSVILAGYGLWNFIEYIQRRINSKLLSRVVEGMIVLLIFFISINQFYPYQPAIPSFTTIDTPVIWLHQVNSNNQFYMIDFAKKRIGSDTQKIADYTGYIQEMLFYGLDEADQVIRTLFQVKDSAYLLLHIPGNSGVYQEQAEYRSKEQIEYWRFKDGMSTIYDNGGSFILYYPDNPDLPFYLEKLRVSE